MCVLIFNGSVSNLSAQNGDLIFRSVNKGPAVNSQWIYDTPPHSDVETKLRQLLIELGNEEKILGIQVCTIIQLFI